MINEIRQAYNNHELWFIAMLAMKGWLDEAS